MSQKDSVKIDTITISDLEKFANDDATEQGNFCLLRSLQEIHQEIEEGGDLFRGGFAQSYALRLHHPAQHDQSERTAG